MKNDKCIFCGHPTQSTDKYCSHCGKYNLSPAAMDKMSEEMDDRFIEILEKHTPTLVHKFHEGLIHLPWNWL